MDEKISLQAVDKYSEAFANRIASQFFASKEKISGSEILSLCEIKQVNLFVIRELLHAWEEESDRLKSPYFNYQAGEVVQALQAFQNTLSNHILISRNDFLPLLKKAVSDTLYLVLDPYDYYSDSLDRQGKGTVSMAGLQKEIKYLRINRQPLEKLVEKFQEKKISTVTGNEAFGMLDSILEEVNFTPEDIDMYVSQFSKLVALDIEKLYEPRTAGPMSETPAPPVLKKAPAPPAATNQPKVVANNFRKIKQIKDGLTINQKFMFTKILFSGDFEIFSQAIERLDSLDNLPQAIGYLETNYPNWDKESEEYLEFLEIVEKRFS